MEENMGFLTNQFCRISFLGGGYMFIGLLILVIVLAIVFIPGRNKKNGDDDNEAFAILKNRLAKGEISIEEYEQLKDRIK